jgi:ferric-dicitrate binding protein FerR (iron transport regulator)
VSKEPEQIGPQKLEKLLSSALAATSQADENHFEFDDLSRFAVARREQGESWEMPAHLSRCSLCLEAFQVMLEGVPASSHDALKRFVEIGQEPQAATPHTVPFPSRWKVALKIAASVALLLGAVWLFNHFGQSSSAHVREGALALADGKVLAAGTAIPGGVIVTTTEPTSTDFADGSKVELSKETKLSFRESLGGTTTVALNAGEIVATVAKQKGGKRFTVKTPLGEVTVVGTRFSVACQKEAVTVYQSSPGQEAQQRSDLVRAVRVSVFEGVVRVRRLKEEALVNANQTAVLRENEPGIELSGERR